MLTKVETGLIPVYENEKHEPVVNARELHEFLNIGRDFSTWIKDKLQKYGFVENQDFIVFTESGENPFGGRPSTEYILTMDTGKEIAMVENNIKGSQIRRYFIAVEKKYKQAALDMSKLSPELQMFQQIFKSVAQQELRMKQLEEKTVKQTETITAIKDTIIQQPDNWREELNKMFNRIVNRVGDNQFREMRTHSYQELERRAGVRLEVRLENMRDRMLEAGKSKTAINEACKLDVIAEDKKLREIYSKIVQELYIKHVA
jgi:anti-repressor protein